MANMTMANMTMTRFNFGDLVHEVADSNDEIGVTFEDKQLSWDTAEDVKDVVFALEKTKIVHFLQLDGNTLGVDAAAAIGQALARHPEFRKALWKNLFTRRLKTEIPLALMHLGNGLIVARAHLAVLDLSDNALGPNGMVGLENLLRSEVCYSLVELHLNNCGLGIGGGQMLAKALLDCHESSTACGTPLKLKIFVAGRNRLENDGAKAIARIFSTLKTLEEISMPQNSIYHQGIAALAKGLKQNPNLRLINFNDNTLTQKGAAVMAEVFGYTPNLQHINFGDCLIKTNGAYFFADALERDHLQLQTVDLSSNEIDQYGGLELVQAMMNKPNLTRLNLDGNQFGYEGRETIKDAMQGSIHPHALLEMEDDQSDGGEDDDDEDADEEADEEADEDDEAYEEDHQNDTTEEADEYEYEGDDYSETAEEAYTTSTAYTTNMFNEKDMSIFNKSVDVATTTPVTDGLLTPEKFCLSQQAISLHAFEAYKSSIKLEALKHVFNQFTNDNHLIVLIFTALKCGHLATSSTTALDMAQELFKEVFDYAIKTEQECRVVNFLLIQLGLLRSENKFNSPYDFNSCRYAMRETLDNNQISSDFIKNSFQVFLDHLEDVD